MNLLYLVNQLDPHERLELLKSLGISSQLMPLDLVFVRHCESEGNKVVESDKAERDSVGVSIRTEEFTKRLSRNFRLTKLGAQQAVAAGDWLRDPKNVPFNFTRLYASPYIRTRETAGLLDIEGIWFLINLAREREWGYADNLSRIDLEKRFGEQMQARKDDSLYARMPGGQSIMDKVLELRNFFGSLARECSDGHVMVVTHGEVIKAAREPLERVTPEEYQRLNDSEHDFDEVHNGQVVHYTRVNPEDSGDVRKSIRWVRSVWPWDLSKSSNDWKEIVRPTFTSQELLAAAATVPRLID